MIQPSGADLGFVPTVIRDACGAGHQEAVDRPFGNIACIGDAILCGIEEIVVVIGGDFITA